MEKQLARAPIESESKSIAFEIGLVVNRVPRFVLEAGKALKIRQEPIGHRYSWLGSALLEMMCSLKN